MSEVRPDEISAILRRQLTGFEKETDVYEVGTVLQIGDGVARVYGLTNVMASELVEFPNGVVGQDQHGSAQNATLSSVMVKPSSVRLPSRTSRSASCLAKAVSSSR